MSCRTGETMRLHHTVQAVNVVYRKQATVCGQTAEFQIVEVNGIGMCTVTTALQRVNYIYWRK
jgi:hypothetical protein